MQIEIKRRTGFFGMASPIKLIQVGQQIASISHDQSQLVTIDPSQPLTVKLMMLRSQPYRVKHGMVPDKLEIVLNPQLKQFYFLSYGLFFVFAGLSGLFYTQGWLWPLLIMLIVLYGVGLRYFLVRGYLIREVE